ncbi:hypothetical protein PINS_up005546 [Pythium insidiosum]|nr:hypothetical protein PINS_up005546 [Pythium insidiosum]
MKAPRTDDARSVASLEMPRDHSDERDAAFEAARQRFAMYGRRNAHVSHYVSPSKPASSLRSHDTKRPSARASSGASTSATASVRRSVRFPDEKPDAAASSVQNTLLLQENGELALRLDDMEYHLDGILAATALAISEEDERLLATAQSVVALARVCQQDGVLQAAMKLSGATQSAVQRLRQVLRLMNLCSPSSSSLSVAAGDGKKKEGDDDGDDVEEDEEGDDGSSPAGLLRLAVAVLAFTLALSADADEVVDADVLDVLVASLSHSHLRSRLRSMVVVKASSEAGPQTNQRVASSSPTEVKRKAFLKRKKSSGSGQPSISAIGNVRPSGTEGCLHGCCEQWNVSTPPFSMRRTTTAAISAHRWLQRGPATVIVAA